MKKVTILIDQNDIRQQDVREKIIVISGNQMPADGDEREHKAEEKGKEGEFELLDKVQVRVYGC